MIAEVMGETNGGDIIGKSIVPGTRSLFQSVKRFVKFADIMRKLGVPETYWLMHIESFMKFAMDKCIFNKLMDRPRLRKSNAENNTDSSGLDNWIKSIATIHPNLLTCTIIDKASFMSLKRSVRIIVIFKTPNGPKNIKIRWTRHQIPRIIFNKSIVYLSHGHFPIKVLESY